MAAAEEPATNTNKKHVAVDITMHFKVILGLISWICFRVTFKRAKRFTFSKFQSYIFLLIAFWETRN